MRKIPAMLLAMPAIALAEHALPKKPLMAYTWTREEESFDNIVPFFWIVRNRLDPVSAKKATDAMPEGHRVLFSWNLHSGMHAHPKDRPIGPDGQFSPTKTIWWDHGAEEVAGRFDRFFRRYKEIGGKLDVFVLDYEAGMSNWSFGSKPEPYAAIMADPRFPSVAEELGFSDLERVRRWRGKVDYCRWNVLMRKRVADYISKAVYEPMRRHYPNVRMSNYNHRYGKRPFDCPDRNGHNEDRFSIEGRMHVGTHQSASLYCAVDQIRRARLEPGEEPFGHGPWQGLLLGTNRMRSMVLSSDVPVMPWISHKAFAKSAVRGTDYYQELIFHVGLCNPDAILLWNPTSRKRLPTESSPEQDALVSRCLKQLDEVVAFDDHQTLVRELSGWYDDYILTGMNAGGRSVWRFTSRSSKNAVLAESPATFDTPKARILIPSGRIYTPRESLSEAGFWVVAPIDATPLITRK